MSPTTRSTLWYVAFGIIIVLIGVVSGFGVYLYSKGQTTQTIDTARGLQSNTPTFTGGPDSSAANLNESTSTTASSTAAAPDRLWHVFTGAVAGMAFIQQSSSTELVFADRATGYIYEANTQTGQITRLTNTLEPKTYRAVFPGDGEVVIETAANDEIQALAASFQTEETATSSFPLPLTIQSTGFPPQLREVTSIHGKLFYLAGSGHTGAEGYLSSWNGAGENRIFSSPIADWLPMQAGGDPVILEKPADGLAGYAYQLDSKGGMKLLFGPTPGLTLAANSSGSAFFVGSSDGASLSLFAESGSQAPKVIPLSTVADKCVFAPGTSTIGYCAAPVDAPANFLNDWYRGLAHTQDSWWQVNAQTGETSSLYTLPVPIDVVQPIVDPSGQYLAFLNNTDQSLWVLRIAQ